jgi:CheY-like chemotaxis protein
MASVLLIDDDPDFLKLGAAQLANRGHKVTAVASAVEALKLTTEVDFIISDVVMDNVDGERYLDEMTKRGKSSNVPILMISARKDLVQSVRMIAKGAIDLARKPIDWDRIDGMITSAGNKRKAGAAVPPMPATAAPSLPVGNKPKVLIVEDSSTQRALWRLTLSEHVANAKIVPDGAEALKSLEAENYALLITDLDLGAISGWEVAEAARKKNPKLPIIVISSRVQTGRPADHVLPGDRDKVHCFHKADRADALLQAGRILGLPPVM